LIYITAEIYSIVFGYIYLSQVTWLEHWIINNFNRQYLETLWIGTKGCFISTEIHRKGHRTIWYYPKKEKNIYSKDIYL